MCGDLFFFLKCLGSLAEIYLDFLNKFFDHSYLLLKLKCAELIQYVNLKCLEKIILLDHIMAR
jgi:hypothetical protein